MEHDSGLNPTERSSCPLVDWDTYSHNALTATELSLLGCEASPAARTRAWRRRAVGPLAVLSALPAIAWLGCGTGSSWRPRTSSRLLSIIGETEKLQHLGPNRYYAEHHNDKASCGLSEEGINYWARRKPFMRKSLSSEEDCRMACFNHSRCNVWTWGKRPSDRSLHHACFLIMLEQFELPWARPKDGMVSGNLPCEMERLRPRQTLFCVALMQPTGYEKGMLAMQKKEGLSLFGCDSYAVYSNQPIAVLPDLISGVINSTLKCGMGGEFGTALNTDIFIVLWKKVITDAAFRHFDWTVKVDPDAVFFPETLRRLLAHHPETDAGVYLNNCKYGMHGPIEVFSRNAVHAFARGMQNCEVHLTRECNGTCQWGEDMYVDQCLKRVLHVDRHDDWGVLMEDHCPPNPKNPAVWTSKMCKRYPGRVSYHPFKTVSGYKDCIANEAEGRSKLPK